MHIRARSRVVLSVVAEGVQEGRTFRGSELVWALFSLLVVAVLALGPHIEHGGFYMDDWSNAALALQPPGSPSFSSAVSSFADISIYRPILVVYVTLTYFVFGMHMHYHLAWAAFLAVLAATMFYGVLRVLGVPWVHALLIGALTIVFPWSDSTRLWTTADQATLSITLAGAGLLIALLGMKSERPRWHAYSAGLYLLSILSYEITLPLIACAGFVYCLRFGWRAARYRWLADLFVAGAGGIWVGLHTVRTTAGLSGDFHHVKQIITAGSELLGRTGLPLGTPHTGVVLVAIAAILAAGLAAVRLLPGRFATQNGWNLYGWILMSLGGLALAVLGWMIFIPADPYYTPSIFGETNRVNGLAAFGLILLVYGTFGIVGTLVSAIGPRRRAAAAGVTLTLGVVLLGSYTHVLRRHISIWDTAFAAERTVLTKIKDVFPHLSHGTTLFASSFPNNQTLGVPIFTSSWDLNGAIVMEYGDSSLAARPVRAELRFGCRQDGVVLVGAVAESEPPAPYGSVRLLNLQTGEHANPRDQRECRRVVGDYPPGPLYLSAAY